MNRAARGQLGAPGRLSSALLAEAPAARDDSPTMQPNLIPSSVFRPAPPPLWYVTNGELTVGPVVTGLLIRGVEAGRVPDFCHVSPYHGEWRTLSAVREIAALSSKTGAKAPSAQQLAEWARPVERIKDEEELSHTVARRNLGMWQRA